jgi:hypothetical protein
MLISPRRFINGHRGLEADVTQTGPRGSAGLSYNDRLTASGEMLRGLGAARWPAAV